MAHLPVTPRGDRRPEGGASIVIVAISLIVLMIFAAFAIDIGQGYNQRRQVQSAADAAALAAAQATSDAGASTAAIEVSLDNLDDPPTLADWTADFAACADAGAVARGYTVASAASPCVRFTPNRQRVRVRVPDVSLDTFFAGAIGLDSLTTNAFAEAQIDLDASGDVLPYALTPSAAGADPEVCLKVGSALGGGNLPYPYDGCNATNDSGNFRKLDIAIYGNFSLGLGSTRYCPPGGGGVNAADAGALNTALGVDHPVSRHPTGAGASVDDWTNCPNFQIAPNGLHTQTGNANEPINEGFYGNNVGGVSGIRGRLAQASPYSGNNFAARSGEFAMDNTPLWTFIPAGATSLPGACRRETFDNGVSDAVLTGTYGVASPIPWRTAPYPATTTNTSKAHLRVCMEQFVAQYGTTHEAGEPILFSLDTDGDPNNRHYDIQDALRFGFVPLFWSDFGSGSEYLLIRDFAAVYIQTLYFQCNNNSCTGMYNPGRTATAEPLENFGIPIDRDVDATSAMLLRASMLPVEIVEDAPGQRSALTFALIR